jgi:hypothetical protein
MNPYDDYKIPSLTGKGILRALIQSTSATNACEIQHK